MAIDLIAEDVFPLSAAPDRLPRRRGGKKIHRATIYRWVKDGLNGVRLETLRLGGGLYTSMEALQRFADRAADGADADDPAPRTTSARRRAVEPGPGT